VESNEEKIVPVIVDKLTELFTELQSKIESIEGFSFNNYINIKGMKKKIVFVI